LAVLFVVGACGLGQPTSTNNDSINEGKNIFLIIIFMLAFNEFTKKNNLKNFKFPVKVLNAG